MNNLSDFTQNLLFWNQHSNTREMPWKGENDPYKIWLSEIILQQTRVEQGLSYYQRFVERFPTVLDLALADDAEVFKYWEGLGYYSRCRNLLATARKIAFELQGNFPSSYEGLLSLKGIGPYTAAAISSFAYGLPKAVLDGNVFRVLSRYFGIDTPTDSPPGKKLYAQLAEALLAAEQPGTYNQAIMDFGAVICKPKQPLCPQCPQKDDCEAFKLGVQANLPVKEKRIKRRNRYFYYFLLKWENGVYLRQRLSNDIWQQLHEWVLVETEEQLTGSASDYFYALIAQIGPLDAAAITVSEEYRQQLSHQTIVGRFIEATLKAPLPANSGYVWMSADKVRQLAFPRFITAFSPKLE